MSSRPDRQLRLWLLATFMLAVVLIPFAVWGDAVDAWSLRRLEDYGPEPGAMALLVTVLLAADILLPVPASVVSTAAGALLGLAAGLVCSIAGMTIGSSLGYWIGRSASPLARSLLGDSDTAALERSFVQHGHWFVTVSRAVPLFAESSTMLAGAGRMPFARFMMFSTMANVGVSAFYVLIGAYAADIQSPLLAFAGAILAPLVPMIALRLTRRRLSRSTGSF
jgi:uncharacterized membrane protein YdjX (TVP38/TMEM64 family)